jgi:hypothetical protein
MERQQDAPPVLAPPPPERLPQQPQPVQDAQPRVLMHQQVQQVQQGPQPPAPVAPQVPPPHVAQQPQRFLLEVSLHDKKQVDEAVRAVVPAGLVFDGSEKSCLENASALATFTRHLDELEQYAPLSQLLPNARYRLLGAAVSLLPVFPQKFHFANCSG